MNLKNNNRQVLLVWYPLDQYPFILKKISITSNNLISPGYKNYEGLFHYISLLDLNVFSDDKLLLIGGNSSSIKWLFFYVYLSL